jgi:GNAT superfamily N-acetyltransferase
MSAIRLERLTGDRLAAHLPELARLRITVFRDFPYLYRGSEAYEQRYLRTYAAAEGSVIVGAFDGNRVIGASTGLPLAREPDDLTRPFAEHGYDVDRVFYFGESVLLPEYRGHGIGVRFFAEREAHARELGRFAWTAFCAVVRPADHPRRPEGYVPLDAFWRRRGYQPVPGLVGRISWQDLDEEQESAKPMQFWVKALTPS